MAKSLDSRWIFIGALVVLVVALAARLPSMGLGLVLALLLVLLVGYMCRPAGDREVDHFAALSGLAIGPTSRRFVAHHLTTGRRLRVVLVLGAIIVPPVVATAIGASPGQDFTASWSWVLWACMAGTLWAELSVTRPTGGARVASLVPRQADAYLSRPLRWGPVAAALVATVLWAGVAFLPSGATDGSGPERAGALDIAVGIAFVLVVPLVVVVAQRWILRRPQPLVAPDLVAADDAVRAASVRNLAAVGTALVLLYVAGGLLQYVQAVDVTVVDWSAGLAIVLCTLLAVASWASRVSWRPVRRHPFSAVDAPA